MERLYAIALAILVLLAVPPAHAAWDTVASPSVGKDANTLLSVAAVTDDDVWTVGAAFNSPLSAYRTLIEHWSGTSWSVARSPNATDGYNILNGVAAVGARDVWAVGQAAAGSIYQTLIEHWNGRRWTIVPSPNVPNQSNILRAVRGFAPNDIWAVGYTSDGNFVTHSLTLHWNGAVWNVVTSPSAENAILFAVDGVASNDVWAVGISQANERTLTLHWDGTAWSVIPSPNDSSEDNFLFGVAAVASDDVWAVGNAGSLKTLAIHWNGASWSVVPTPAFTNGEDNEVLVGIVALSSANIWTAGQYLVPLLGSAQQTLTENWNGSSWNVVRSPNAPRSNNRLSGITVTPGGTLWSVGTTGVFAKPERTLILRNNP